MGDNSTGRRFREGRSRRSVLEATAGVATVGGVAVAGCLGRSPREGTVVMTAATDVEGIMYPKEDEASIQEALWDAGLDEDIQVEIQTVVSDSDARMEGAQSALQAGRAPPDIHMMDSGWTIPFILREQTTNLSEELPQNVLDRVEDEYLEAALETARDPETDDLHGLPLFPDLGFMLYREDLIEEAGHDTSDWGEEPPSWEEFSTAVSGAMDEGDVQYGWTTQGDAYEGLACCSFNEVMTSWGGAYFGGAGNLFEAGDRPITVDDENVVNAIRMMRTFIDETDPHALEEYEEICPTAIVQWTEQESLGPFEAGDAVAHRNWTFSIAATGDEEVIGEDLGVTTMPYAVSEEEAEYDGVGGTTSALGGWNLVVSPYTDRREEALEVLEAFTHEEVMLTILELQGFLPPIIDLVEEASEDDIGAIARYTDQIERASETAIPRPVTDVWPEQSALIYQAINAGYRGEDPEEGMSDLAARLERSEVEVAEQHGD
ncbi:extracellular solute-binding protein [Natronobacterium texcoconense]|uniref:ABC-type glycerol-3-phosphate transport system, substrate-binding protein n=1 Tax=Natronobacterium texcoconense TaxID=1095778 RepID=A0A1H1IVT6_NATTX|nr:extracellular solute-binding protein [Natronobacterium texcoconense]SDR41408.1 ABC-type glycerol-3-phosphate transport system, substrate-binding protein [Natronobacterium texcoconense]